MPWYATYCEDVGNTILICTPAGGQSSARWYTDFKRSNSGVLDRRCTRRRCSCDLHSAAVKRSRSELTQKNDLVEESGLFKEPCHLQCALNESQPLPIEAFNPLLKKTNFYSPTLQQCAGRLLLQSQLQLWEWTMCRCVHTTELVGGFFFFSFPSIWHEGLGTVWLWGK